MKVDYKVAVEVPFKPVAKQGKKAPRITPASAARPARIAVLMALAIRMDELLREGLVKDQAELAQLAGVTRARVTQVMNLLNLAPDIQEHLLLSGATGAVERSLRFVMTLMDWNKQRRTVLNLDR